MQRFKVLLTRVILNLEKLLVFNVPCNSLFSICWSKVRKVDRWTTSDLNHILNTGDYIYKSLLYGPGPLNQICYLNVDDLPHEINLTHGQISLAFLEIQDGEFNIDMNDTSLVSLFYSANATGDGFLIFVSGVTLAVMYDDSQCSYYLFDSHSRNQHGLLVPDGTSVLLKYSRLYEIEIYLKHVYLHAQRRTCFFQLQFIKVVISDINKRNLRQNFRNATQSRVRSENFGSPEHEQVKLKRKAEYAKCLGTPEHEKLKQQKRVSYANRTNKNNKVKCFKENVQQGPFYVCVICHRSLYLRSVLLFNGSRYDPRLLENCINVLSYDRRLYICKTCHKKLHKKQKPCQSVSNKLENVTLPDGLSSINRLERVLVSKRLLFKKITIMPKGQSPKLKRNICNIPVYRKNGMKVI